MGDFKVGDRVRVREDAPLQACGEFTVASRAYAYRRGREGSLKADYPERNWWIVDFDEDSDYGTPMHEDDLEHLEPAEAVSASLSACERVLWASTQEYIRAANTEAETKREGYLSAFRQVVEEDRPELAGKQWTVEDGQFVVQQ